MATVWDIAGKSEKDLNAVSSWRMTPVAECLVWAGAFFALRMLIFSFANVGPFYSDEATFTEGALRMAANRLQSGDYLHGPVIYYLLLGVQALTAAKMLVLGQVHGADDFIRWYAEDPERLLQAGRGLMSFGGAAVIAVTMLTTLWVSQSVVQARGAALALLSMPLFHHASWYIKEDLWAALFGILAAGLALRRRPAVVIGACWGLAIAAKYTAVILGPALWVLVADYGDSGLSRWTNWCKRLAKLAAGALAAHLIVNPHWLIHPGPALHQLQQMYGQYLKGANSGIDAPPPLAGVVFGEFLPFDIGAVALGLVIAALALGRGVSLRKRVGLALGPAAVILLLAVSRAGFPRTLVVALPWLAVIASLGWQHLRLKWRFSAVTAGALLAAGAVVQTAGFYRYATAADTRQIARVQVENSVPGDAVILMEGVYDHFIDAGPRLRLNVKALRAEQEDILSKGAAGKLNQVRQQIAAASPAGRFEVRGVVDFATSGTGQLDEANVVITSKWPAVFPEARAYNIPEDSRSKTVMDYVQGRRLFHEMLGQKRFTRLATIAPTLVARWSFIDRPDPRVFGVSAWLQGGEAVAGPEIGIYLRARN